MSANTASRMAVLLLMVLKGCLLLCNACEFCRRHKRRNRDGRGVIRSSRRGIGSRVRVLAMNRMVRGLVVLLCGSWVLLVLMLVWVS